MALVFATLSSCTSDSLEPGGAVASVIVTPSRVSVGVGASSPLTVEVRDASGKALLGHKVVWASKDPAIATVSGSGVVSGVSPGSVQVAATAEGKSAIVDVTVNPKAVATIRLTPNGDQQMLEWTAAGDGARFMGLVHHTDAEREWAYDRASHVGKLDKALDEANARGWTVVDMKNDWKVVFPAEK